MIQQTALHNHHTGQEDGVKNYLLKLNTSNNCRLVDDAIKNLQSIYIFNIFMFC